MISPCRFRHAFFLFYLTILLTPHSVSGIADIQPGDQWSYQSSDGDLYNETATADIDNIQLYNMITIETERPFPKLLPKQFSKLFVIDTAIQSIEFSVSFDSISPTMGTSLLGLLPLSLESNIRANLNFTINYNTDIPPSRFNYTLNYESWTYLQTSDFEETFTTGASTDFAWEVVLSNEEYRLTAHHLMSFERVVNTYTLDTQSYHIEITKIIGDGPVTKLDFGDEDYSIDYTNLSDQKRTWSGGVAYTPPSPFIQLEYDPTQDLPISMEYTTSNGTEETYTLVKDEIVQSSESMTSTSESGNQLSPLEVALIGGGILIFGFITYVIFRRLRAEPAELLKGKGMKADDMPMEGSEDNLRKMIEARECCKLNGSHGKTYCSICGRVIPGSWVVKDKE